MTQPISTREGAPRRRRFEDAPQPVPAEPIPSPPAPPGAVVEPSPEIPAPRPEPKPPVRFTVTVDTTFAPYIATFDVPRDEWEALSLDDRRATVQECARVALVDALATIKFETPGDQP